MDKYEYKVRAGEIKALIARGEYVQAAEIADTIDWRRVKSVMMLCTISDLYKINRRYEDARDMLLLAYDRHPGGRTIVYSLCELSIKMEEFVQAVEYYKEFVQIAPKDTGRYVLQYKLYEAQDVGLEERVEVLEELKEKEYREKWAYELAYLYHRMGLATRCVEECDELILWFGEGKYVVKAMELKMLHQPLTPEQFRKYEGRFQPEITYGQADNENENWLEQNQADGYDNGTENAGTLNYAPDGTYPETASYAASEGYNAGFDYNGQTAYEEQENYGTGTSYMEPADYEFHNNFVSETGYPQESSYPTDDGISRMMGSDANDYQVPEDYYGTVEGGQPFYPSQEPKADEDLDIQVKTMNVGKYATINLQKELAEGLKEVLGDDNTQGYPEMEDTDTEALDFPQIEEIDEEALEDEMQGSEVFFGNTDELTDLSGYEGQEQNIQYHMEPYEIPVGSEEYMPEDYEAEEYISEEYVAEESVPQNYGTEEFAPEGYETEEEEFTGHGRKNYPSEEYKTEGYTGYGRESYPSEGYKTEEYTEYERENYPSEEYKTEEYTGYERESYLSIENKEEVYAPEGYEAENIRSRHDEPDFLIVSAGSQTITPDAGNHTFASNPSMRKEYEHSANSDDINNHKEGRTAKRNSSRQVLLPESSEPPKELAGVLSMESDGQLSLVLPENDLVEKQITGQLSIEDILAEWEHIKQESEQKRREEMRKKVAEHTGPMFTEFETAMRDGLLEQLEEASQEGSSKVTKIGIATDTIRSRKRFRNTVMTKDDTTIEMEDDTTVGMPEKTYVNQDIEVPDLEEVLLEPEEEVKYSEDFDYEGKDYIDPEEDFHYVGTVLPLEDEDSVNFEEQGSETPEEVDFYEERLIELEENPYSEDESEQLQNHPKAAKQTDNIEEEVSGKVKTSQLRAQRKVMEREQEAAALSDYPHRERASGSLKKNHGNLTADSQENAQDKAVIRQLTQEEKELFGPYIQSKLSRQRLITAVDNISLAAYTGNVILTGDESMDTMTLAKNMIRDIQLNDSNFSGKMARISGAALNEKKPADIIRQLKNGSFIIQKASGMSATTVEELYKGLQQEDYGIIVILEDNKKAMNKFLKKYPQLLDCFTARMDVEAMSNEALAAFGRKYAKDLEYSIDELGVLALHTRIEDLQTSDHAVTVMDVKKIVDEAIRHASKKSLGHFVDVLFAKRYDEEDMIILRESDFIEIRR